MTDNSPCPKCGRIDTIVTRTQAVGARADGDALPTGSKVLRCLNDDCGVDILIS